MVSLHLALCVFLASFATLGSANSTNATTAAATNATTAAATNATTAAATTAAATTAAATTAAATTAAATTAAATTAAATTVAATTAAATTAGATTAATTTAAATTAAATTTAATTAAATTAAATTGAAGTATVFTGHFELTMSAADATAMIAAFETDTSVRTALENGIATGLNISSSMVTVTGVSAHAHRRLAAGDTSEVQVDYTITVPSGSTTTLTTSDITGAGTALKDGINSAMTAQSLSYAVTALEAPAPTVATVTITTTAAPAVTSTAHKVPASCVAIAAGLGAVALLGN